MISKSKIKNLITLVQEFNGKVILSYIPESVLDSIEELHNLYYGGWNKIEIGKFYRSNDGNLIEIKESNIDKIVDEIYYKLSYDIGNEILKALENLNYEAEDLKYFDRSPDTYEKFRKEVHRLINQ